MKLLYQVMPANVLRGLLAGFFHATGSPAWYAVLGVCILADVGLNVELMSRKPEPSSDSRDSRTFLTRDQESKSCSRIEILF